jgi:hypothetical protein
MQRGGVTFPRMRSALLVLAVVAASACGPKELSEPKSPGEPCDRLGRCGEGLACHGAFKNHEKEPGRCSLEPGRCFTDRDCHDALHVCDLRRDAVGKCIEAPYGMPRK